jgi:hypothetical protein
MRTLSCKHTSIHVGIDTEILVFRQGSVLAAWVPDCWAAVHACPLESIAAAELQEHETACDCVGSLLLISCAV